MDIEFITGLWTHISDHLEKNHTKKEVSRNEPFSGHCKTVFSFFVIYASLHIQLIDANTNAG